MPAFAVVSSVRAIKRAPSLLRATTTLVAMSSSAALPAPAPAADGAAAPPAAAAAPGAAPFARPPPPYTTPDALDAHVARAWDYFRSLGSPAWHVAPMVDQSELPFRMLCRAHGATAAYTPMLHARLFLENKGYRSEHFTTCDGDRPLFAQFCANDPEILVKAAAILQVCTAPVQALILRASRGAALSRSSQRAPAARPPNPPAPHMLQSRVNPQHQNPFSRKPRRSKNPARRRRRTRAITSTSTSAAPSASQRRASTAHSLWMTCP